MARARERSDANKAQPITIPRRFVAAGVFVVLLPGWAVLLTYLYERGYAGPFGIDRSYIDITTSSIAATGLRFLQWIVIVVIVVQMASFGVSRFEFRSRGVMYAYTLFEGLVLGAVLYWAAWDYAMSALGKALVYLAVGTFAIVVGVPLLRLLGRHEKPEDRALTALSSGS